MAQQPDFQSHLHQQLNGIYNPSVSASSPEAAVAMQSLQRHLAWYEQHFGISASDGNPNPSMQQTPFGQASHPVAGDVAAPVFLSQAPIQAVSTTPVSHGHSHTVPNTPQNYNQSWPIPPPSHAKHQRSQSYQFDVAPMAQGHDGGQFVSQDAMFNNGGSFSFSSEQDYAASAYSSSVVDPSSPPHQHSTPMPTLFEEPLTGYGQAQPRPDLLLQAAAGAEQDFNDPNFMMGGGLMCPEQAALDAAGIDATYIDTGITEEQINSWLVHPVEKGESYHCKWEGCDTKINRKENARSHVQNHLDDRRFRCNPCGKRFNRLHDTKRHHLTHTNERPAICPCGKTFARADALTRHRQRDMCEGVLPGFEKAEEEKPKRGRPKKDRSSEPGDKSKRPTRPDMETRARKAALARSLDQANGRLTESMSSAASVHSLPATPPQDSDDMDADFLGMSSADGQFNQAAGTWLDTPPTSPPSAIPARHAQSKIFIDLSIPEEPESVSPSKLSTRSSPCPANGPAGSSFHDGSSPAGDANTLFADYSSPAAFNGTTDFTGESSPMEPGVDIFNDTLNFDAIDCHPDVGRDVFSPPGESCSGSSVYNSDWDTVHVGLRNGVKNSNNSSGGFYSESLSAVSTHNAFPLDDFMPSADDEYDEVRDMLDSWVASH
ncbi:Cell wall transcription factor ACE2 [Lecanosticta acicola]|uniref:Cell wall transcription factor ACE2 n=1 Tax=Lecanosticta acicola TaxID=111012 RepID=A0AAI8YV39_9PEZI|nr:Cell wall transcription factor ACE2 [Lecanosticta acicola]